MFGLGNRWAGRHGAAGGDLEKRVAALEEAYRAGRRDG